MMKKETIKLQECLDWYFFHMEANEVQDLFIDPKQRIITSKRNAFKEIEQTIINSFDMCEQIANEIYHEQKNKEPWDQFLKKLINELAQEWANKCK
jgi:hypothetical protein